MNQHASRSSEPSEGESHDREEARDNLELHPQPSAASSADVADEVPGLGEPRIDDTGATSDQNSDTESSIRVGSPFESDPFEHDPNRATESFEDAGPLRYTALGAVSASIMVVGFAAAAAYFFPAGGTMIAALGCVLSILGMYSSYRFTAAGLLAVHLCLFLVSYTRTLS